jgi:hypothetical protein
LDHYPTTSLTSGQLTMLTLLVYREIGSLVKPGAKKPPAVCLRDSVTMVVMLMRRNVTQEFAGGIFGCSQATASRRWDLLRPVIAKVLRPYIPDPAQVVGRYGTPLADGTVCPTWDWKAVPDLYSGKARYTGMNVQIACNLNGDVAAIGPVPVPGARHDAYAFEASGLKESWRSASAQMTPPLTSATSVLKESASFHSRSARNVNWKTGSGNLTRPSARPDPQSSMPWQR